MVGKLLQQAAESLLTKRRLSIVTNVGSSVTLAIISALVTHNVSSVVAEDFQKDVQYSSLEGGIVIWLYFLDMSDRVDFSDTPRSRMTAQVRKTDTALASLLLWCCP